MLGADQHSRRASYMARAYYNEVPVDVMEIISLPGVEELRPYEYWNKVLETRLTLKTAASSSTFQKLVRIDSVRFPQRFDLELVHEREVIVEFNVELRAYYYLATYNYREHSGRMVAQFMTSRH